MYIPMILNTNPDNLSRFLLAKIYSGSLFVVV